MIGGSVSCVLPVEGDVPVPVGVALCEQFRKHPEPRGVGCLEFVGPFQVAGGFNLPRCRHIRVEHGHSGLLKSIKSSNSLVGMYIF